MSMSHCPKCGHAWRQHETTGFPTEENPHPKDECNSYEGMGNWCGCKQKRPRGWSNIEDVIEQVERHCTRLHDPHTGTIGGYVIDLAGWQALVAQLREGK